jgi:hypothetical protein
MLLRPLIGLFAFVLSLAAVSHAQTTQTTSVDAKTYEHSRAGIEQQFADILAVVRTGDQPATRKALDTLGIPEPSAWIAANFSPEDAARETAIYPEALKKFQSHVWWVLGNFGTNPAFALQVEDSALAKPPSDTGLESLIPRPKQDPTIETFRFTSNVADPKLGSQSWVSSFIYLDGRYRMVGGTYPFWAEALTGLRGPMSLPPATINGRVVQGAAFRTDAIRTGVDAILQMKIEINSEGKAKKIHLLSGEPAFLADAKQYLEAYDFGKLPDDPRFANAKRNWDMEVVFFTPKVSSATK